MNEPKNPYVDSLNRETHSPEIAWQEGYEACESHLRSLVGEKGREALEIILGLAIDPDSDLWEDSGFVFLTKDAIKTRADSLLPIIGGIVEAEKVEAGIAVREEAIRKEGRQEVAKDIAEDIILQFDNCGEAAWQMACQYSTNIKHKYEII